MRKEEFFRQLEYLLQDISEADLEDALMYYRDYLDEAGPENEEHVIAEFGSPERVAAIIRADVTGNLKDGGSFTERGYEDERFRDPNFQVAKRLDLPDERESVGARGGEYQETENGAQYQDAGYNARYRDAGNNTQYHDAEYREYYTDSKAKDVSESQPKVKKKTLSTWKWILIGIFLVVLSPFILTVGGCIAGAVGILIGAVVMLVVLTAAAFIASVVIAGLGFGFLFTTPLDSLILFGVALAGVGCGLLGLASVVAVLGIFFPFCVKGIWKGIRALASRAKEAA